jgi:AAA ATPase domain
MSNYGPPGKDDVVGREDEVAAIIAALRAGTSLSITGERRIGKSWTLREAERNAPKDWILIYRDIENLTTLESFEVSLIEALEEKQRGITRGLRRIRRNTSAISAKDVRVELTDAAGSWSIQRLIERVSQKTTVVLMLDELPFFAKHLERARAGAALELMNLLRALRQNNANLRIVAAGSVGFHHLLAKSTDLDASVNDLQPFPIGALKLDAARLLVDRRLKSLGYAAVDSVVVDLMCEQTDKVAFYLQHLLDAVENRGRPTLTAELIGSIREHALNSATDPWNLAHYRNRLTDYYRDDAPLAEAVLRVLARSSSPLTVRGIVDALQTIPALSHPIDVERITATINRLELDHYLELSSTSSTSTYQFVLTLVRDLFRKS